MKPKRCSALILFGRGQEMGALVVLETETNEFLESIPHLLEMETSGAIRNGPRGYSYDIHTAGVESSKKDKATPYELDGECVQRIDIN